MSGLVRRGAWAAHLVRAGVSALALSLVLALGFAGAPAAFAEGESSQAASDIQSLEYWLEQYGFDKAWATTQGADVTVAVIDTGVDGSHADLQGQVLDGTDVSGMGSSNGQTPIGSDSDHGTLVASLIAGTGAGEDGHGMLGVAPGVKILPVSMAFGVTGVDTDQQVADGIRWAVDHGASVINMSLTRGTLDWPESWDDAFLYAAEHDVVVVAAAGNRGSGTEEVGAPATIPGVLTVAGLDRNGEASWDASSQGITIAVSAPSEDLVGALPGGGYATWEGTSGATPIVAGLVALIRSAYPKLDAANVINRVIETAQAVGDEVPSPVYGYGRIDAAAALTAVLPLVSTNPMGDLAEWIAIYRGSGSEAPSIIGSPVEIPEVPSATASVWAQSAYRSAGEWIPWIVWGGLAAGLVVWVTALLCARNPRRP